MSIDDLQNALKHLPGRHPQQKHGGGSMHPAVAHGNPRGLAIANAIPSLPKVISPNPSALSQKSFTEVADRFKPQNGHKYPELGKQHALDGSAHNVNELPEAAKKVIKTYSPKTEFGDLVVVKSGPLANMPVILAGATSYTPPNAYTSQAAWKAQPVGHRETTSAVLPTDPNFAFAVLDSELKG